MERAFFIVMDQYFYVLSLLALNLSWEIVHLKVPPSSSGADFRLEEYA